MKIPKTKVEMDKDLENMDNFIDNIESYPPPKVSEFGAFSWNYEPIKTRFKSFLGGMFIGALIGLAVGILTTLTIVLNLLVK